MRPVRLTLALCLLFVVLLPTRPCWAQIDAFALPHPFALPGATTARLFGMGGIVTCIQDQGFGNPAYAGHLDQVSVVERSSFTEFDSGLDLRGNQVSIALPLKPGVRGVQVTGFTLDSNFGPVNFPGVSGAQVGAQEWDAAFHYGQRLNDRWSAGVALSPVFHSNLRVVLPTPGGGPVPLLLTRSTRDWGFRFGSLYQVNERAQAGLVYDRYDEDVQATGAALGGATVAAGFKSETLLVGMSYRVTERLLGAVEWQDLSTRGAGTSRGDAGWRFGAEYALNPAWSLRAGSNDGSLSAGVTFDQASFSLRYAYIKDWNEDLVGALLGGSDTHQFEAAWSW